MSGQHPPWKQTEKHLKTMAPQKEMIAMGTHNSLIFQGLYGVIHHISWD